MPITVGREKRDTGGGVVEEGGKDVVSITTIVRPLYLAGGMGVESLIFCICSADSPARCRCLKCLDNRINATKHYLRQVMP